MSERKLSLFKMASSTSSEASLQDELVGEWNLLKSENFEKFLEKLGVGTTHRLITILESTTLTITQKENIWTIFTEGSFAIHKTMFEIGKAKEERTSDGRLVTSTWSIDRNKKLLWHEANQTTGVVMKCELYVKDGQLIHKMKCGGVKARRIYAKSRVCTIRRLSSVF